MSETKVVYGICWFQPEKWDRLLEISSDRDSLESSYSEWRSSAQKSYNEFRDSGAIVKKVNVDPDDLLKWCNANGLSVNGRSRSSYATYLMNLKSSKVSR